ncbi:hypothetical protein DS2_02730 [Catenovulum agarivorans DS-2]|uniref:Calcium-dependent phosphoinositide phospholipase C n=1 Tax=Catenovulum agarivorans DS-2 TaxID=1328313 RepID=W7QVF0_9ALTE|nr:Ca2+-dependent phosphoinositide-specific phospholipase C [Catenovulum agarivorans]EWH11703.1 hypothetical protein DS2_02730 [Catenovulum agarivorans DS-2]
MILRIAIYLTLLTTCSVHALPLNQLQVIGSHNSYKKALDSDIAKQLNSLQAGFADKISYAHPSLTRQLDMGLRQLEIDVLADSQGGLYQQPLAQQWTNQALYSATEKQQLAEPGFKVLHIPDVDIASHCIQFSDCLAELKTWSINNPNHLPVYVMFNVKESRWGKISGVKPEQFTAKHYQQLNQLIVDQLGLDKLLTPSLVQQQNLSLAQSVKQFGWPDVEQVRGKFIFIFDGNPKQLDLFEQAGDTVIFGAFNIEHNQAAILLYNNPQQQAEQIKHAVAQGFIVRTRADEFNAKRSPNQRALAAINSGAQIISSDFYLGAMQQPINAPSVSFHLLMPQLQPQQTQVQTNLPFVRCLSEVGVNGCNF